MDSFVMHIIRLIDISRILSAMRSDQCLTIRCVTFYYAVRNTAIQITVTTPLSDVYLYELGYVNV